MSDYFALQQENNWIEDLRKRLPYSFKVVSKKNKQYELFEPELFTGPLAAVYHNFWKRGNVYYVIGKLADEYRLDTIWQEYRRMVTQRLLNNEKPHSSRFQIYFFYNSMQMEKLWKFAQENTLDRERVVMTNISQAIELCLKAIKTHAEYLKTHAEYRQNGKFLFDAGHDLRKIYQSLPPKLRAAIEAESKIFAEEYSKFRTQVEKDIEELKNKNRQQQIQDWERIANRIEKSNYTAILNSHDPAKIEKNWFQTALEQVKDSMYYRYSPETSKDEYPTKIICSGLMLGRFFYEHLFPVPFDEPAKMSIDPWYLGFRP